MSGARLGRALLALAAAVVGAMVSGCACQDRSERHEPVGPPPTFDEVAAKYNARVAGLDQIWSRTVVRYKGRDADGKPVEEQGEGYLQLILPRSLYVTVGKVGETGFELGSDGTRYWWIDVQRHEASVGRHDRATADKLADSGVPVHPLDLVEVLGVTALERSGDVEGPAWTKDGLLRISLPGRWGRREILVEPARFEPTEVRLLDAAGGVAVRASLTDYTRVETPGEPTRMAGRLTIEIPGTDTEIKIGLFDPENRGPGGIRASSFSFESLTKEYRVQHVRDLDRASVRDDSR